MNKAKNNARNIILFNIIVILLLLINNFEVKAAKDIDNKYITYSINNLPSSFFYSDNMLLGNANDLSDDLSKVTIGLAASAYKKSTIISCLDQMGYDVITGNSIDNYNLSRFREIIL